MSRSTRMFEIIQLLRSTGKPLTAEVMAGQLEVTKRTVYRDIATLQSMRVPVEGEAGVGYIMRPGYDLPPLNFNIEEIETISVALGLLGRTGDSALQRQAKSVVDKISSVLPKAENSHLNDRTVYSSNYHDLPESKITPDEVRGFVRAERKLKIRYRDEQDTITNRTVLPLAVIYYVDSIVLGAWCELRDDFRHFRIDRILSCNSLGASFSSTAKTLRKQWRARCFNDDSGT